MAKQSGLGDGLIIGGVNVSGDVNSLGNIGGGPAPWEVTGIDKSAIERIGLNRDGRIEFVSYFNKAAGAAHLKLSTLPTADTLITYLRGTSIGSPAASMMAKQIGYDPTRGADGSLTFAVSGQANAYGLEWGQQLTAGMRTDTAATNGTSLDGAASSAFGAQVYLQASSAAGTSFTVTIEDSADNVSFAAVTGLAFTAVTPAGSPTFQRLATANNATIRRYVRAVTTGTFTSAVFNVVLVRNETAGIVF